MTVDYSEMAEQVKGPINSGYFGGGQTTARVAFKYLLGAAEMANEGTFRPLRSAVASALWWRAGHLPRPP